MPQNPERASRGGDVEGETKIDVSQGEAIAVAKASFDPGYSLDTTLSDAGTDLVKADLVQGYCTGSSATGEGRKPGYK